MSLEKNLRELRKVYGLSQEQVAEAIGVKRTTLVTVEKGERELTSEELGKLADYLGVDIVDLMTQEIPDIEKYQEMIVETLKRYCKYSGKSATKTMLAKLLYLADFGWYYNHLQPMSGMKYRRIHYGPVPDQFFRVVEEMIDAGKLNLSPSPEGAQWITLTRAGKGSTINKLSDKEKSLIDSVAKRWKDANTNEIVTFTHNQLPYQVSRPNQYIPYELITQEEPENVY